MGVSTVGGVRSPDTSWELGGGELGLSLPPGRQEGVWPGPGLTAGVGTLAVARGSGGLGQGGDSNDQDSRGPESRLTGVLGYPMEQPSGGRPALLH